jgi:trehalose utilization protein
VTEAIEETARRLYPTSPRQRYADKASAKACQRAYIRGHMHGAIIDRDFVDDLVLDLAWTSMDHPEMADLIIERLEERGFVVPPEKG